MMKHTIQKSFKLVAALIVVCIIILSLFGVACYFIEQVCIYIYISLIYVVYVYIVLLFPFVL